MMAQIPGVHYLIIVMSRPLMWILGKLAAFCLSVFPKGICILLMNKPLSKSKTVGLIQTEKLNILTVAEVIGQFNMKSPKERRVNLTDCISSAAKFNQSMSAKKHDAFLRVKLPTCLESTPRAVNLDLKKKTFAKSSPKRAEQSSGRGIAKIKLRKGGYQQGLGTSKMVKMAIGVDGVKDRLNSARKNDEFRKKTMSRLMKQLSPFDCKKGKEIVPKLDIPKLKQTSRYTMPTLNSDRSTEMPSKTLQRSTTTRIIRSIKLDSRPCNQTATCKHTEEERYFRKGSSASTLSLKSKETLSMQYFEDYEQLFSKQLPKVQPEGRDPLSVLQEVKNKIYFQINSLDKKLLMGKKQSDPSKQSKICLKKKTNSRITIAVVPQQSF